MYTKVEKRSSPNLENEVSRKTIGFIVNPIAGMGGIVGLKGTDGGAILKCARAQNSKIFLCAGANRMHASKNIRAHRKMSYMKKLVSMGRGGSGKTTFVALMTNYFIEKGETPLLLIDVDPDQNLGEMVGIDLKEMGKKTISELLTETFKEGGGTTVGVPPSERIESKIWEVGLYEGVSFDLIAVGTKFIEGCYCLPDAALRKALENLTKTYRYVLIDSPAGLEHLNRRISTQVDDIFDIIDPSQKAFNHVERAYRVAKEVKIHFKNFYVIAGHRVPRELEADVEKRIKQKYLGKIAYDKNVENYSLSGKSLLKLPSSSPAYNSVRELMKKAAH